MATVCGGTLALMDAGVPISAPVAASRWAWSRKTTRFAVLTDIVGDEDHYGDMDFKVAGTREGITALQMDIKITGVTERDHAQAPWSRRKAGRMHILGKMDGAIPRPRDRASRKFAPRLSTIQIPGEDRRRHRPRRQDDPLDHRGDRLQDRHRGRRQGDHRLARRAGGPGAPSR